MMKDLLYPFEDKYNDTKDIPDDLWQDMICLAIDQARSV